MTKGTEALRAILLIAIFTLVPVSFIQAADVTLGNEYDSLHLYNALENKAQFRDFKTKADIVEEELTPTSKSESNFADMMGDVTERQNFSREQVSGAIKDIEESSGFRSFIVRNDLGVLKFQLVQIKDTTFQYASLGKNFPTSANLITIAKQIQISEGEQKTVEDLILREESKFSLFGWVYNII